MKKLIVILGLMLLNIARADRWVEIGYKSYADVYSYSTYTLQGAKYVSMWFKELNPGDWETINGKKIWFELRKIKVNCNSKTLSVEATTAYDLKGNVIDSYQSYKTNFKDIPPETVGETKWKYMCAN